MPYTLNQNLTEYIYSRLPNVYRKHDTSLQLKKYLESLVDGGLLISLNEILAIEDLLDPEKCPSEFLPYLFSNYGAEYSPNIPEIYQRRIIQNYAEILRRKGTKSVAKYLAREITGFNATITEQSYSKIFRTWTSNSRIEELGITQSKTFSVSSSDLKYTLGEKYNPQVIKINLEVPTTFNGIGEDFKDQLDVLAYYLEKFLPPYLTWSVVLLSIWDDSKIWYDSNTWYDSTGTAQWDDSEVWDDEEVWED